MTTYDKCFLAVLSVCGLLIMFFMLFVVHSTSDHLPPDLEQKGMARP